MVIIIILFTCGNLFNVILDDFLSWFTWLSYKWWLISIIHLPIETTNQSRSSSPADSYQKQRADHRRIRLDPLVVRHLTVSNHTTPWSGAPSTHLIAAAWFSAAYMRHEQRGSRPCDRRRRRPSRLRATPAPDGVRVELDQSPASPKHWYLELCSLCFPFLNPSQQALRMHSHY